MELSARVCWPGHVLDRAPDCIFQVASRTGEHRQGRKPVRDVRRRRDLQGTLCADSLIGAHLSKAPHECPVQIKRKHSVEMVPCWPCATMQIPFNTSGMLMPRGAVPGQRDF